MIARDSWVFAAALPYSSIWQYAPMKTTVDIHDSLLAEAKGLARARAGMVRKMTWDEIRDIVYEGRGA